MLRLFSISRVCHSNTARVPVQQWIAYPEHMSFVTSLGLGDVRSAGAFPCQSFVCKASSSIGYPDSWSAIQGFAYLFPSCLLFISELHHPASLCLPYGRVEAIDPCVVGLHRQRGVRIKFNTQASSAAVPGISPSTQSLPQQLHASEFSLGSPSSPPAWRAVAPDGPTELLLGGFPPGKASVAEQLLQDSLSAARRGVAWSDPPNTTCPRCGDDHAESDCTHRVTVCFSCKQMGHIAAFCPEAPRHAAEYSKLELRLGAPLGRSPVADGGSSPPRRPPVRLAASTSALDAFRSR